MKRTTRQNAKTTQRHPVVFIEGPEIAEQSQTGATPTVLIVFYRDIDPTLEDLQDMLSMPEFAKIYKASVDSRATVRKLVEAAGEIDHNAEPLIKARRKAKP